MPNQGFFSCLCHVFQQIAAMRFDPQPLIFEPIYKQRLWGGRRLESVYGRRLPSGNIGESWELSDRDDGMSLVAAGAMKGASLRELCANHPDRLVGKDFRGGRFPILVKILDARQRLSLQVHPAPEHARDHKSEPKTEMWYVLQCDRNSVLYAGLKKGINADILKKALADGSVLADIGVIPVRPHHALFIPAGLVHAVGEGCMLLEIQQNSDTTYRLYDWGRVGHDGKPRQVHPEKAFQAIKWDLDIPRPIEPEASLGAETQIVACEYFRVTRIELDGPMTVRHDGYSFSILFAAEGSFTVETSSALHMKPGDTCLIPAFIDSWRLAPAQGQATVVRVTLPPSP